MAWYEKSEIYRLRRTAAIRLGLPDKESNQETATAFWARVEKAGLLDKVLAAYDQIAAENAEWERNHRGETKQQFAERVERGLGPPARWTRCRARMPDCHHP